MFHRNAAEQEVRVFQRGALAALWAGVDVGFTGVLEVPMVYHSLVGRPV